MATYNSNEWKSFVEKVGSSLVGVTKDVAHKAKQVGDSASLNIKLLEKENELEKIFFELGVEYYNHHQADVNYEYPIMNQIEIKQQEIRELRDEIASRKKMDVCYQCGEYVDLKAKYCPHCGAQIVFDRD